MLTRDDYEILTIERIGEGTANDNPDTVMKVRHKQTCEIGYVTGPHGTSCCAIGDWLGDGDTIAKTREEAIEIGCDFRPPEDLFPVPKG